LSGDPPLEAFEQTRLEPLRHPGACVFDGDPQMAVLLLPGDAHGWPAVASRVGEQVRDDPLDDERIDHDDQVRLDVQSHIAAVFLDDLFEYSAEDGRFGPYLHRSRI